ncbi:hypothetical protein SAMN05216345_12139 [Cupriavidus sp. YR651]|uniref:DUF2188 domain-containing protein n=1 Tax=Cupriavidus sp. YR651 TaxID=1855315 RepID=UPI0008883101|nr:DUF2188 domain-containing protein [Cupriavidus sp. YR651]SDD91431.1 hypothetical protein SAMN05216345_12139 [Cupriavidus sp. YR651]
MTTQIQVVPYRDGWDVIHEGARYADSHHADREVAVMAGTVLARGEGATLVTYDRAGRECGRVDYATRAVGALA